MRGTGPPPRQPDGRWCVRAPRWPRRDRTPRTGTGRRCRCRVRLRGTSGVGCAWRAGRGTRWGASADGTRAGRRATVEGSQEHLRHLGGAQMWSQVGPDGAEDAHWLLEEGAVRIGDGEALGRHASFSIRGGRPRARGGWELVEARRLSGEDVEPQMLQLP